MAVVLPSIRAAALRAVAVRMPRGGGLSASVRALGAVLLFGLLPLDARAAMGDGLQVGNGRLHLGAELLLRFDSQAGAGVYGGYGEFDQRNPSDGIGTLRGLMSLNSKTETYRLNLQGSVDRNQYAGLVANTRELSFWGANVAGSVIVNPNRPVGFELMGNFLRSDRTTNPVFGIGVLSLGGNVQARVKVRPWGGRLEVGFGGDVGGNFYSPQIESSKGTNYSECNGLGTCDAGLAAAYDSVNYRAVLEAKWRLFPKTGITFSSAIGARSYLYGKGSESYSLVPNQNAMPYSAMLGFGSLLSTRLSFAIKGGVQGITFTDDVTLNVLSPIGQAELGFRFTSTTSARLGYLRTLEPVGGSENWFADQRIFIDLSLQPIQRLLVYGVASLDLIEFGTSFRTDTAFLTTLRLEYAFLPWLKMVAGGGVSFRRAENVPQADSVNTAFNYTRLDASLGVSTLF